MTLENTIKIRHEGVNYQLEQMLWAWKNELECDVNLYKFNHHVEMLREIERILKEYFGRTSWTKQEEIKELMKKDML